MNIRIFLLPCSRCLGSYLKEEKLKLKLKQNHWIDFQWLQDVAIDAFPRA
jgi:hypothetical protein